MPAPDAASSRPEVLLIGGRAGVGKTSVAAELHAQLSAEQVQHAVVEGDTLDQAWPVPWEDGLHLAEVNLAAMWRIYQDAGYSRLIYTNTASVRADVLDSLLAALGGDPVVHAVLLTADTPTAATRLARREIGSALEQHLHRSERAAVELEEAAPAWVRRIATDGRTVEEVARDVRSRLDWLPLTRRPTS